MTAETILIEQRGRVGLITLNRPDALNALTSQLMTEVVEAAQAFDADPGIGAIVITGAGRAFAAGADIKEMAHLTHQQVSEVRLFAGWDSLADVRTPVIAAVNGFALGGGCEIAMMCDLIIASETAKFGQPEISLGVIPGIGGTQRLTRAVGKAKAMDLILTGRMMDAHEAERAGLVARVVAPESLLDEAMALADTIAAKPKPVAQDAKSAVNAAFASSLEEGVRTERELFYAGFARADQKEGMAAFIEKRTPEFRHE
jgi:enoyl-CoA hydratase